MSPKCNSDMRLRARRACFRQGIVPDRRPPQPRRAHSRSSDSRSIASDRPALVTRLDTDEVLGLDLVYGLCPKFVGAAFEVWVAGQVEGVPYGAVGQLPMLDGYAILEAPSAHAHAFPDLAAAHR